MTSPYDPYGKIYTILSQEWTAVLWSFEPVFIPQIFREHFVLVLGWTTGRRGYVSIAMVSTAPINPYSHYDRQQIIPNIPDGANPDHYLRIRSPRRRAVADDITIMLRKNKRSSALVELSYVKLDSVWEVPLAILREVPRTGMQLMLRPVAMEKIMRFYSKWGWDQAWGQTYQSLPQCLQWSACCQDQNESGSPESIKPCGQAEYPPMTRQPCRTMNRLSSSGTVEQDGDTEGETLAESDSTGSWDSAYKLDDEMVYAGDAHCAALAKLLREAQS